MSEAPAPRYPKLGSCCLDHLKLICSFAIGLVGAALAEGVGSSELTQHMIVAPEVAGFLSAGGICLLGWSAVDFVRWRKRRAEKRAAARDERSGG